MTCEMDLKTGFKDEKCPKHLRKAREQAGPTWEGLCEPLQDDPSLCKPRLLRKAPSHLGLLAWMYGCSVLSACCPDLDAW